MTRDLLHVSVVTRCLASSACSSFAALTASAVVTCPQRARGSALLAVTRVREHAAIFLCSITHQWHCCARPVSGWCRPVLKKFRFAGVRDILRQKGNSIPIAMPPHLDHTANAFDGSEFGRRAASLPASVPLGKPRFLKQQFEVAARLVPARLKVCLREPRNTKFYETACGPEANNIPEPGHRSCRCDHLAASSFGSRHIRRLTPWTDCRTASAIRGWQAGVLDGRRRDGRPRTRLQ
jgi:hypothetical protein